MIEERKRLEAALAEFKNFLGSVVHREYVAATKNDLEAIETRILEDEVTSIPEIMILLDQRAQRRVFRAGLTSFEDTVANLEARIAQMKREEVQPNATQQETETENEQEE